MRGRFHSVGLKCDRHERDQRRRLAMSMGAHQVASRRDMLAHLAERRVHDDAGKLDFPAYLDGIFEEAAVDHGPETGELGRKLEMALELDEFVAGRTGEHQSETPTVMNSSDAALCLEKKKRNYQDQDSNI